MILLAEHDEPTLAAKKKRQPGASSSATSTPKNRVWSFENTPSGRPNTEPELSWETATGSVQYTYQNASGRAEWLSRDPLRGAEQSQGANLYWYVQNNSVNGVDPSGLDTNITVRADPVAAAGNLATHCSIIATCPSTGESLQFELGAPTGTIPNIIYGGLPPTVIAPHPPTPPPSGSTDYSTVCNDSCCKVLDCLKQKQASTTPPPYYVLSQNSNTYAHNLLSSCGCEVNAYAPSDVPPPYGPPTYTPNVRGGTPAGAVGW